jgi:hypothetical protein
VNRHRLLAGGLLVAMLAGCAILQPPAPEPPPEPEPPAVETPAPPAAEPVIRAPRSEVELLVEYFQRLRTLPAHELAREQERARGAFARSGSDYDRVRLAMTLALPNAAADEARALELLEPVARNRNSALNALAYMVSAFVQEQRRLGANVQGMQRKLEQLRSLERALIEREQAGQRRP